MGEGSSRSSSSSDSSLLSHRCCEERRRLDELGCAKMEHRASEEVSNWEDDASSGCAELGLLKASSLLCLRLPRVTLFVSSARGCAVLDIAD